MSNKLLSKRDLKWIKAATEEIHAGQDRLVKKNVCTRKLTKIEIAQIIYKHYVNKD